MNQLNNFCVLGRSCTHIAVLVPVVVVGHIYMALKSKLVFEKDGTSMPFAGLTDPNEPGAELTLLLASMPKEN